MRVRAFTRAGSLLAALSASAGAVAPSGSEFQVNTYTPTTQFTPAVAVSGDGRFVVVWMSFDQDAAGQFGIFGQRFGSDGVPVGVEFLVNEGGGGQSDPEVAIDDDGEFVVVWKGPSPYGPTSGIFARRFDSAGVPLASEFRVNSYTANEQYQPSIAMDADGDFVIVWTSYQEYVGMFSGPGIFGQLYSSTGSPVGAEFHVNTYLTQAQTRPWVAADADGDFVVVWQSHSQDGQGSFKGTFGRRFDNTGAPASGEFLVNSYTNYDQRYPTVAMDDDGDFLVAWESFQDGSSTGIFAQRFGASGARAGSELQINAWTTEDQRLATVAAGGDGDFVVAWQSRFGQDGNLGGVFARAVSLSGLAGGELQVNTHTIGYQVAPKAGMDSTGNFVVVWQSAYQDGGSYGVFGQRFEAPPLAPADVDGDGQAEALTDGLLILRFLFGLTDSSLVGAAVDQQSCSRCSADAIVSHLASLGTQLDIDGDGELVPLTDGLLVLRYLFGLRGAALIGGAVDTSDCTRCDASAIEPHIAGLLG